MNQVKVFTLEYFFALLLLLFLGQGTAYTHGGLDSFALSNMENIILSLTGKAFMIILGFILIARYKINLFHWFNCSVTVCVVIWGALQAIKYNSIPVAAVSRLISLFFVIIIINVYKRNLCDYIEHVSVRMTIVGLLLWCGLVFMPNLINGIGKFSPIVADGMVEYSFGIWGTPSIVEQAIPRNCGFAWEPGRYGAILSFVLLINLYRTRFKLINNLNFWIIILGIASTLSTTAFGCVGAIAMIYLANKNANIRILILPALILGGFYVWQLDFVGTKIKDLWSSDYIYRQIEYYSKTGQTFTPQRFDAIMFEAYNIVHDPIIGNAGDQLGYLMKLFGANMSLSNGVLRIFANMGVFIGIWYYIQLYKGSKSLMAWYSSRGAWGFFIVFVLMNFSYAFIFDPIFLSIILYPYFEKRKLIKYVKK